MKVAYYTGLQKVEIREEPRPRIERAEDVLLRVDRVGICGSDVHYYSQGRIGQKCVQYPATLGHECSGTVVEVGTAVEGLSPGQRVFIEPAIACGQCDQCRAGRVHTCRNVQFMGSPREAPGAVAEYRVMPAENCLPLPKNVTLDQAALLEPLSIGLHAVRLGAVYPAARVAILGAGPIGLSVLLCAKATAPCTVYMTDLLNQRLGVAGRCGADWTGNADKEDIVAAIAAKEPRGLDLVFECSGNPVCIGQAQRLLVPGGTLVQVGIFSTPTIEIDMHILRVKEITLKSSHRQNGCVAPVMRLVSQGHINPDLMLTHHFPMEQIGEAFEMLESYRDGVIKAMVDTSEARD
jgi:L-iditol 2-dehydrogenase